MDGVLSAAEDVLRSNRVDHVFVGGITVLAFGVLRTTADVDVIARIDPRRVRAIVEGFQRSGFLASTQDLHDALVEGGQSTIQDTRSAFRIDLIPASTTLHREALRTKRRIAWHGYRLPFVAPEHTIVAKLRWGSEQDFEDALGIYLRQKENLDLRALRALARSYHVVREFEDLEDNGLKRSFHHAEAATLVAKC